jgi:hypothetical protein
MVGKRDKLLLWLANQPQDKEFEITERRKKRSLNANAYFHLLCQKVAEKTSQSLTEVKNQMIADFGQFDKDMGELILRDDIEWRKLEIHLHPTTATKVLDNGKLYRVYFVMRGSQTYDTKEMSRLIDGIVQEAKQQEIETLTPAELAQMIGRWKPSER